MRLRRLKKKTKKNNQTLKTFSLVLVLLEHNCNVSINTTLKKKKQSFGQVTSVSAAPLSPLLVQGKEGKSGLFLKRWSRWERGPTPPPIPPHPPPQTHPLLHTRQFAGIVNKQTNKQSAGSQGGGFDVARHGPGCSSRTLVFKIIQLNSFFVVYFLFCFFRKRHSC